MLGDSAKIQREDAAYLNSKRQPGEPEVEPLYGDGSVFRTLVKMKAVPYGEAREVLPGVEVTFHDAGHLLGSAMVHVRMGEKSLTFTGDVGRPGTPILRDPSPVPGADLIICESTYGGHAHEPMREFGGGAGGGGEADGGAGRPGHHAGVRGGADADGAVLPARADTGGETPRGPDLRGQPDGDPGDGGVRLALRLLRRRGARADAAAPRPVRRGVRAVRREGA